MHREDIVPMDINAAIVTTKTKRSPIGVTGIRSLEGELRVPVLVCN